MKVITNECTVFATNHKRNAWTILTCINKHLPLLADSPSTHQSRDRIGPPLKTV